MNPWPGPTILSGIVETGLHNCPLREEGVHTQYPSLKEDTTHSNREKWVLIKMERSCTLAGVALLPRTPFRNSNHILGLAPSEDVKLSKDKNASPVISTLTIDRNSGELISFSNTGIIRIKKKFQCKSLGPFI